MVVNVTNARDFDSLCLSANVGNSDAFPGINNCTAHAGWIVSFHHGYEGSIRLGVPGTDLCLYRTYLKSPRGLIVKRRKLDEGFRLDKCEKRSKDEVLPSLFRFKVLLEKSVRSFPLYEIDVNSFIDELI